MGLKNFVRRQAMARALKEVPMLGKAIGWLTDPAAAGRKRGVTAALAVLSGALRGSAAAIKAACAAQMLPGWACAVDPLTAASWVDVAVQWIDTVLVPGTDALAVLMGSWALIDAKRKGTAVPVKAVAGAALLALLLAPGVASAQDMPVNAMATEQTEQAPAPISASQAAEQTDGITVDVQTWTLALVTRDERREYAGGRVTLDAPAGPVRLFARADIAGTQSDAFDFGDYSSFRSIELFVGARYPFRSGVALAVAGGVTYSIEGKDGPADPRIYSALALVRLPLPGGGYAYAGGGHRGPVGGLAAVASVSYPVGPTRALVDYDFPLQVDSAGQPRPWVLRTGIAVPIKRWTLR